MDIVNILYYYLCGSLIFDLTIQKSILVENKITGFVSMGLL